MRAGKDWLDSLGRATRTWLHRASRGRRCAVLIDGDNVPPRIAEALHLYASSLGRIETIELFDNFASIGTAGWAAQMRVLGITGVQHYKSSNGKNSSDIALVVRAMDLLHSSRPHDYVLVSSDADFSALAHRLRRSGARVHGIGSAHATKTLRHSCTAFMSLAELNEWAAPVSPELWTGQPEDAEDRLLEAIVRVGGARRWVPISDLGAELKSVWPLFDARAFSRRNLNDLCSSLNSILMDRSEAQPRVKLALRS